MYIPPHFHETNLDRIAALVEAYSFATLVTTRDGLPDANHIPFFLVPDQGPQGTLYGHLARVNPQAAFAPGEKALAIFTGPHAYVSPSWYAAPGVPTWNFAVAHAWGSVEVLDDPARQAWIVNTLTERYDPPVAEPDGPAMPAEAQARMLPGIVAFALRVERWQAKFKLSQNRTAADRQGVIAHLGQDEHPEAQALAGLMLEDLARDTLRPPKA